MIWFALFSALFTVAFGCTHDGELLPNRENCRKYFKCSNGRPAVQSCPGTLIFDHILKICNWPDTTTCIQDLVQKKSIREKLVAKDDEDKVNVPNVKREEVSSLFHIKERDFTSLRDKHRRLRERIRQRDKEEASPVRTRVKTITQTTVEDEDNNEEARNVPSRGALLFRNRQEHLVSEREREKLIDRLNKNRFETVDNSRPSTAVRTKVTQIDKEKEKLIEKLHEFDKEREELLKKLNQLENDDSEDNVGDVVVEKITQRPKKILKPIMCRENNELHPNPQNCRKYFKCENGLPSLQSCPANLIFDASINVCNWPDATECVEDPEAILPTLGSSDHHPPSAAIFKQPFHISTSSSINNENNKHFTSTLSAISSARVPTLHEALEQESIITSQYPYFKQVLQTVQTLDNDEVEKISPNRKDNPDNVKRVEFILNEENFEDLFPRRHRSYTYRRLLQAIGKFPAICGYQRSETNSDNSCRRTLATMFAHFAQETGEHNQSDQDVEEWRQGLAHLRELGCTDTSPGCNYNDNCIKTDSLTRKWSCGKDAAGEWKKYYGRGAKQLSYNFNYGQFSQAMFGHGRLLLDSPDLVADTWLNLASATWFYVTPQPPKPSMLHVIDGTWVPNAADRNNGILSGFGSTINIINGGIECNKPGGESKQAKNRIEYYKQFAWYLYVDYEQEELGCSNQGQFTQDGAGAIPIYWDKDWSQPFTCKLVPYQTAHSALVRGEYVDCVEEHFNVKIK